MVSSTALVCLTVYMYSCGETVAGAALLPSQPAVGDLSVLAAVQVGGQK